MRAASFLFCALSLLLATGAACAQDDDPERIGDWAYVTRQDSMGDAVPDAAFVPSPNAKMALGVRCEGSGPEVVVMLPSSADRRQMASPEEVGQVQYRFDDHPVIGPELWEYENVEENLILFAPFGRTSLIAEGAKKHMKVVVRVDNADGKHVRSETLSLMGAARALSRLSCVE